MPQTLWVLEHPLPTAWTFIISSQEQGNFRIQGLRHVTKPQARAKTVLMTEGVQGS